MSVCHTAALRGNENDVLAAIAEHKTTHAQTKEIEAYADNREKQNTDKDREEYSNSDNNCATFARDALAAGGVDTSAATWSWRPTTVIGFLEQESDAKVNFDAGTGILEIVKHQINPR